MLWFITSLKKSIPVVFSTQLNEMLKYVCLCFWQVEDALEGVKNATNEQDLANRFKEFGKEMVKLNYVAARRQQVTDNCLLCLK